MNLFIEENWIKHCFELTLNSLLKRPFDTYTLVVYRQKRKLIKPVLTPPRYNDNVNFEGENVVQDE